VPEPVISSDSDVELVEDPRVEQRRLRLRRAVNRADGPIPTGAAEVEWASEGRPRTSRLPVAMPSPWQGLPRNIAGSAMRDGGARSGG